MKCDPNDKNLHSTGHSSTTLADEERLSHGGLGNAVFDIQALAVQLEADMLRLTLKQLTGSLLSAFPVQIVCCSRKHTLSQI